MCCLKSTTKAKVGGRENDRRMLLMFNDRPLKCVEHIQSSIITNTRLTMTLSTSKPICVEVFLIGKQYCASKSYRLRALKQGRIVCCRVSGFGTKNNKNTFNYGLQRCCSDGRRMSWRGGRFECSARQCWHRTGRLDRDLCR
jgi:hypothetical protein